MKKRIYLSSPHMGGTEMNFIEKAFETNWIAPLGPNVNQFEESIKEYTGTKHATALSSGTSAIHLALISLGVKENDIVFCSDLTFIASANPITYLKAEPVFIDCDESLNMDPEALEKAFKCYENINITPKAVVVVNLYGQSADYNRIKEICDRDNVPIIEDAAESLGTTYKGKQSGTLGDIGIFSFNGNKIITTSGGGMMISNNKSYCDKALFLATQAKENKPYYYHLETGYNYRMSNIAAGIGCGQMEVLNERIQKKKQIYDLYKKELEQLDCFKMLKVNEDVESNYWLSVGILDLDKTETNPQEIIDELEKNNIEARRIWNPLHNQPVFKNCIYFKSDYFCRSKSLDAFKRGICLPSDTKMTIEEQFKVIDIIKNCLTK